MRIIAGRHRGTKLGELDGARTRPTADRVRETLFGVLEGGRFGDVLGDVTVVDAFAGTGALGLEALSRGAQRAVFIESDRAAIATLCANIAKLRREDDCRVIQGDVHAVTNWSGTAAGLMFADAPYGSGGGIEAAGRLLRVGALAARALVVIETGHDEKSDGDAIAKSGLEPVDERRAGRAMLHFLRVPQAAHNPGARAAD